MVDILKATFKFTFTIVSSFLYKVTTWVSFSLGIWNLVCYFPDLNRQLCARIAPESYPKVGLGVKMFNWCNLGPFVLGRWLICYLDQNLGTFYARKLKLGVLLTQTLIFNSVLLRHAVGWG